MFFLINANLNTIHEETLASRFSDIFLFKKIEFNIEFKIGFIGFIRHFFNYRTICLSNGKFCVS